jgi:flavin reductase (DIM6/NTAB) family NADH-FMN oxidoreductase RutF
VDSRSREDPVEQVYDARVRGACLISTVSGDGRAAHLHGGCWVSVCAYDPPRVAVAVPKEMEGARLAREGGAFAVSLVAEDQADWLDGMYAEGRHGVGDLGAENFLRAASGCPVAAGAVGYLDCRLAAAEDLGDALLAIGDLKAAAVLHPEKANLTVNAIQKRARSGPPRIPVAARPYDGAALAPAPPGGTPDRELLARVYGRRRWGLFLASTTDGGRIGLHVTGWAIQCSHGPQRMLCCFDRSEDDAATLRRGGAFALTLLAADQLGLVLGLFGAGGGGGDPLEEAPLRPARTGCPILEGGVAYFDCEVERSIEAGADSLLAVGRVVDHGWLRPYKTNLRADEVQAAL